jgi:hypothetical protein
MKIIYALVSIISLFTLRAHAQDYKKNQLSYGIHPGTVITLDGQIVTGYISNGNYEKNQKQCIFYTDYTDSRSRKEYHPADIAGYTIENNQYKTIAYSGNLGFGKPAKNFIYVTKPGAIATYVFWGLSEQLLWQKGDEEPVSNAAMLMNFKKSMLKLVGDNADLAGKIERKENGYGLINLSQIMDEYNTWAQSKK